MRDTLRDLLSSRLQWSHRRVHSLGRTIPLHHTAHRCTCRWRTTTSANSPCMPTDKWARDVHNPADLDKLTLVAWDIHAMGVMYDCRVKVLDNGFDVRLDLVGY